MWFGMKKEIVMRVTESERELVNITRVLGVNVDQLVIELLGKYIGAKVGLEIPGTGGTA